MTAVLRVGPDINGILSEHKVSPRLYRELIDNFRAAASPSGALAGCRLEVASRLGPLVARVEDCGATWVV